MQKNIQTEADGYLARKRRHRVWTKVVSALGCVVVFCTTYALILPAITAEKTVCGLEEHVHTDECYTIPPAETTLSCSPESLGVHSHTEDCYDAAGQLICGLADYAAHSHDANCYDADGTLLCSLREQSGHTHTSACYAPASEGHVHTEACYALRQGELVCPLEEGPEHSHSPECYAQEELLVCTEEEQPVSSAPELICGQLETVQHQHEPSCFVSVQPERELICALEEHTHTDECYETLTPGDPTADLETAADWEATLREIVLTGDYRKDVLAVAQSQLGYSESSRNFILDEAGHVKGYTRYGEWYGIPYGDWCAMFVSFCLRYAEVANFPYNAGCITWIDALASEEYGLYEKAGEYEPQPGDLIFFDFEGDTYSDHVGIVAERIPETETEPARLRTIEGNSADTVQYITYDADDPVILGFGRLPEKETGFACEKQTHTHGQYCYGFGGSLLCPIEEHRHTDECVPASVEEPETSPDPATEPVETEPQPEEELTELSFTGADYIVTVRYGKDAALPEGVTLAVEEIPAGSEEYQSYYEQSVAALADSDSQETLFFARFFDVRFLLDGEKVEPAAPVSVTITYTEPLETEEEPNCQAIHFADDGPELLAVETESDAEGTISFTHMQEGFSVVGSLVTVSYSAQNETDIGPSTLPVDYYVCIDGEWVCVGSTKTGWYGDYTTSEWSNTNRDYITLQQAESILGEYGFHAADGGSLNKKVAYQQKSGNTSLYADVDTPTDYNGTEIVPLSRNDAHPGYNLYYLPGNSNTISNEALDNLDKSANGFYTVKVYDEAGTLCQTYTVLTGGSVSVDLVSGIADWLIVRGSSTETATASEGVITIDNITTPVIISPKPEGEAGSRSVSFKVMVDGQWETVGSLPYYYTANGAAAITTGMAAQFFGPYGYSAGDSLTKIGYSYNDIYEIYYDQSNFCMDITGGSIAENTSIQLYEANHSNAQTFRIWDAGESNNDSYNYQYITPVTNSGLHVNILGGGADNNAPIALHSATDDSSRWVVKPEENGRVSFWTKNAPESACIDLDGGTTANGTKIHIWNDTDNRYWRLVQQYRISNDAALSGSMICTSLETNGDIVFYYLPAETESNIRSASESAISTDNSLWPVSVRDDAHAVYTAGELSNMVQYVQNGGEATVTVKNGEGLIWSCAGKHGETVDVADSQSGGYTTFAIKNITQPIEITATKANPSFTVQYYANIDRYVLGSSGDLDIIDTSGGNLPQNTSEQSLLWLALENTGTTTNQNAGNQTSLYRVKSEKQLTQMYTDGTFNFEQHPGLEYFDKLWEQSNYKLDAVLVLKDGKSADSTNDDDWWWYQINQTTWSNITFTNLASEENAPRQEGVKQGRDGSYCILLQEGTVLRLRYETNDQAYTNQASFHDYDITSGANTDGTWRSGVTGINTDSNYVTSRNGQRKWQWTGVGSSTADVFAFGNQNCETGMGLAQWGGNNINAYNGTTTLMEDDSSPFVGNRVYQGCTFGLVTGLDASGNLIWNEWITAPYLFNDGTATGKHSYNGGSLQFSQTGDTYTLTAANSTVGTRENLEYFFHPSPSSSTTHTHIFTNNFWPMDSATDKTDPLMGEYNAANNQCDIQVNGFWDAPNKVGAGRNNVNIPYSDDGRAHNWFFGMNFSLSFTLTEDYVGPLEYLFFGDDDLWVFLDGRLICDIGGVHSSVGEYVNLWDYLDKGDNRQHTLSFFYTERGASGSTCWMSFTLPSVTSAATGINTGSLQVSKTLDGADGADYSDTEYQFKVELLTAENGSPLNQTFSYSRSDGTYGTVKSGASISLHQNETITISGIPAGTFYRVTELTTQGYHTTVNGNEGYIVYGTIVNGRTEPASFVNTPYYELPSTGGVGTQWLYTAGASTLLIGIASIPILKGRRRKRS